MEHSVLASVDQTRTQQCTMFKQFSMINLYLLIPTHFVNLDFYFQLNADFNW